MKNLLHSKNQIGTNQYRQRRKLHKSTYWNLLFLPLIFLLCSGVKNLVDEATKPAHAQVISPLPKEKKVVWTIVQQPKTEHDQIKAYITKIFAEDSDKAFQLLSCENASLNPSALNDNGDSKDYGLFQINDKWQGFNAGAKRFLFDYRINTLMAYKIYTDSYNTFSRWTCGKKLNI